jgi:hypothetical protein
MPARLSFRRGRRDLGARPRADAARGHSFRRRKPRKPAPGRGAGELPRRLSFRRRPRRQPGARHEPASSLSFRRRRNEAPGSGEPSSVRKLTARLRRGERAPRAEPDALALGLRLLWVGLAAGMLQLLVVSQIAIEGVSADVTPLVAAAAGFLCGSLAGAGFGFALGLFVDLAFVQTLGISAPAAPLTRLLLGTAATVTALGGYGAIEFMLGVNTPVSAGLIGAIIKTTALNSLIAVPVYALTRRALLRALPAADRRPQEATTTSGGLSPFSRA